MPPEQPSASSACVHWQGELLWPQPLPDAPVIDCSQLLAVGSWIHQWFRNRSQRAVVAANPEIKRQLSAARLPIIWYASHAQLPIHADPAHSGVSVGERALLWGERDV